MLPSGASTAMWLAERSQVLMLHGMAKEAARGRLSNGSKDLLEAVEKTQSVCTRLGRGIMNSWESGRGSGGSG
jgi:hypothetical protein